MEGGGYSGTIRKFWGLSHNKNCIHIYFEFNIAFMRLDCRNPAHIFVLDTAMNFFPKQEIFRTRGKRLKKLYWKEVSFWFWNSFPIHQSMSYNRNNYFTLSCQFNMESHITATEGVVTNTYSCIARWHYPAHICLAQYNRSTH